MTTMPTMTVAELIEAKVRRKMAEHARIQARGWNSTRERMWLHEEIDSLLDEYCALMLER